MKRVLLATAGVLLTLAPMATTSAFAQDGRRDARSEGRQDGRQDRGPQGQGQRPDRGGNPGRGDRPDVQRPQPQSPPPQAQAPRPDDNNGRGYRPGDNRRVWPNASQQAQPQRQDPRTNRGPAERRGDSRWNDRGPADRRNDPRWNDRGPDRRYDDRRFDDRRFDNGRYDDRRFDDRRFDNNRRWSQNGYFGYGPRWNAPQRYRLPAYRPPVGFGFRTWSFGQILPPAYFGGNYVLNDFWNYGLPEPPPGTFWIRSSSDALLVERGSGYIIEVAANLFW